MSNRIKPLSEDRPRKIKRIEGEITPIQILLNAEECEKTIAQKECRYEMKGNLYCMSPYIVQYAIDSSCETDFTFSDKSIDGKPIVCIDYQDAQETAIALMKRMLISITPVSENSYAYTDLSRLLQMSIDSTKPFIEFVWLLGGREVSIYIIEATTV
jgi:hypothetical protein